MADFFGFGNDDNGGDDFFSKLSSQPQSQPSFDLNPFNDSLGFSAAPIPPEPLEPSQVIPPTSEPAEVIPQEPEPEPDKEISEAGHASLAEEPIVHPVLNVENGDANIGDNNFNENENEVDKVTETLVAEEGRSQATVCVESDKPQEDSSVVGYNEENDGPDEKIIPGEAYVVNEFSDCPSDKASAQFKALDKQEDSTNSNIDKTQIESNPQTPTEENHIATTPKQSSLPLPKIPMIPTTMPVVPQEQHFIKVTELEVKEEVKAKAEEKTPTEESHIITTPKQLSPPLSKVPMMSSAPVARPVSTPKRPRMFIPTMPAIPTIPKASTATTLSTPSPEPIHPSAVYPPATSAATPTVSTKGSYMSILSDMPPPPPPITSHQTEVFPVIPPHTTTTGENQVASTKEEEEEKEEPTTTVTTTTPSSSSSSSHSPQLPPLSKQPRAGVSFGFGGRMLRSTGKGFTIVTCESVMKPAILWDIYEFPGPLLYGDEQSMMLKVKAFICSKVQHKRKEAGKEAEALLWELMGLLLDKPSPGDNLLAPENSRGLVKLLAKYRGLDSGTEACRKPPRTVRETASDEVKRLYAEERYEDALCLALEEGCICQAIVISQKVPGGADMLARRVASGYLPDGDPTKLGFMLSSPGFRPTDLFRKGGEDLTKSLTENWVSTVIEIAKAERVSLIHKRAIVGELGDRIWAGGMPGAATKAHVCYLIADFGFGAPQDAGTRMALVGWDHIAGEKRCWEDFLSEKFLESFELTEIYEFLYFTCLFRNSNSSSSSNRGGAGSIDEQRYKFFCSFQMRKFGLLKSLVALSYERFGKTAINYINSINGMVSKFFTNWSTLDPASFGAFKTSFNEYAKKIKVYITAPTAATQTHHSNQSAPQTPSPSPSVSPTASLVSKIQQSSSSWFGWMMNKK